MQNSDCVPHGLCGNQIYRLWQPYLRYKFYYIFLRIFPLALSVRELGMCYVATADEHIRQAPPMISNYFPTLCDGRRGLLLYQQDLSVIWCGMHEDMWMPQ